MKSDLPATRDRLIAAATQLFAEHGFHGASMRQLARRGGVNLAASHYHVGSKRDLYLEVLRQQFARIRGEIQRRGGQPSADLARLSKRALGELLRIRVRVMLDLLIGPPPGVHGTLMLREMNDPSEALPVIVGEFIEPMVQEMSAIVRQLAPGLTAKTVERCVFSIFGQVLFYRTNMPALLHRKKLSSYPRRFGAEAADHIVRFSLGGLAAIAASGRNARRGS